MWPLILASVLVLAKEMRVGGSVLKPGLSLNACRAFSKQEAERHGLQPYSKAQLGKRVVLPGIGTEYEDGYEVKWVSMRNIELDDVGPTVEELTRYNQVSCSGQWLTLLPLDFLATVHKPL